MVSSKQRQFYLSVISVLTTDLAESTEPRAFKRLKEGLKVTVKISLGICVVLS